jgi:hypothetical protein
VTAWDWDMLRNSYFVKNLKIYANSTTTEAREKNKHRFGILGILEIFWCMLNLIKKNNQILFNKTSQQFILIIKL